MTLRVTMRSLGLDIGDKRIGIAISDPLGLLATPLQVLSRQGEDEAIAAILHIVEKNQIEHIIVGMPQSMNGTLGPQAEKVVFFTNRLKEKSPVPVEFRDERL